MFKALKDGPEFLSSHQVGKKANCLLVIKIKKGLEALVSQNYENFLNRSWHRIPLDILISLYTGPFSRQFSRKSW